MNKINLAARGLRGILVFGCDSAEESAMFKSPNFGSARECVQFVKKVGGNATKKPGTGELVLSHGKLPGLRVTIQHPSRRKDASRELSVFARRVRDRVSNTSKRKGE